MKVDYRRFGKYMTLANIFISGVVLYTALSLFPGEAAQEESRALFAPVQPSKTAEPKQKSIFRDYSGITVDRFLPRIEAAPGEAAPLVPIPGASSALDRLVKLRGIAVSTEKELSCAIIELLQGGESKTVHVGEEIAGAKVLEITDSSVVVTMDNEEITLHLDATEEYGGSRRSPERSRGSDRPGARGAQSGGSRNARGGGDVPPAVRRALESLPEDARNEALGRWQNATPEQRQKYLQLMESRRRQGGDGNDTQRPRRNPRERRQQ